MEQVAERSKRINQTEFTRGDRVVAVRWLHRFAGDSTRLTFVKDSYMNENDFDIVNSTELRAVGFNMKRVQLPLAPQVRRSARHNANVVPCEPDIHYSLDREVEDCILKQCW